MSLDSLENPPVVSAHGITMTLSYRPPNAEASCRMPRGERSQAAARDGSLSASRIVSESCEPERASTAIARSMRLTGQPRSLMA